MRLRSLTALSSCLAVVAGCPSSSVGDLDASPRDAGALDARAVASDAGSTPSDVGSASDAASALDGGSPLDARVMDASLTVTCDPPTQLDSATMYAQFGLPISNNHGALMASWLQTNTGASFADYAVRVFSGGAWGPVHVFAPSAQRPADQAFDRSGNAVSYWVSTPGFDGYRSSYDAQAMTWSAPEEYLPLRGDPGGDTGVRRLAVGASGAAIYALSRAMSIDATRLDPVTHTWSPLEPLDVGTSTRGAYPATAIDALDRPLVVWLGFGHDRMGLQQIQLRARAYRGGAWTPLADVTKGRATSDVAVALRPDGDALVLAADVDGVKLFRYSPAAAPGSEWGSPELLAPLGVDARLSIDDDGIVTAAWRVNPDGHLHVRRDLGAGFGADVDLGKSHSTAIAIDAEGNVSAILDRSTTPEELLLRQISKRGATWTDPVHVATTTYDGSRSDFRADVVHDDSGHPVVLFDDLIGGAHHQLVTICR